jgi:hypothetical protein
MDADGTADAGEQDEKTGSRWEEGGKGRRESLQSA